MSIFAKPSKKSNNISSITNAVKHLEPKRAILKNTHLLTLIALCLGAASLFQSCSSDTTSFYDRLLQYEGTYEYLGDNSLQIIVSDLDTTLYAVIDKAKYPLDFVSTDTFSNIQGTPVIFTRDENSTVSGYDVEGQSFKLLDKKVEKRTMFPRKELWGNPESYSYKIPDKIDDGLEVGNINEEFGEPESLTEMVKETIMGSYPDVHSILIFKNNKLVLEEYFYDYDKDTPHQLRSATKSFIGGILGIAKDQGFIKSEQEKLFDYFGSVYPDIPIDDAKGEITIEDFLRYRPGLDPPLM